jgi:glycosyltransferase involved in cell wall biosynthesis
MIIAEAFAVGLPVIASNLGSMSTIIDHQRTGLHFEAGNPTSLVEAVRWFGAQPNETAKMREQVRLEYETKYTAERNYAQMMNIYELVLNLSAGKEVVIPPVPVCRVTGVS